MVHRVWLLLVLLSSSHADVAGRLIPKMVHRVWLLLVLLSSSHADGLLERGKARRVSEESNLASRKRVIGGKLAKEGEVPFLVSLWFSDMGASADNFDFNRECGGSLIHPKWVLSAAHCFSTKTGSIAVNWKALAGQHLTDIDKPLVQIRSIKNIYKHPDHAFIDEVNTKADVALLELTEPFSMTGQDVDTISLDTNTTCALPGASCFVVGFGDVYGEFAMEGVMVAPLPVVDTQTCQEAFDVPGISGDDHYVIDDNLVCAGVVEGGVDACLGDSGGPLVCRCDSGELTESGIVSAGDGCGRPGLYGIYARVSSYRDWVDSVIGVV